MNNLQICPSHLSNVATLRWKIQKSHFQITVSSFYLLSPSTASGHDTGAARVFIWTCCGLRQQHVATLAKFQHSVVYCATDQCRKRLEACINVEGGHSDHLL